MVDYHHILLKNLKNMTQKFMSQNDTFTETSRLTETWLKHFWFEMVPNGMKQIAQSFQMPFCLQMARNEPVFVIPAGVEPCLITC